MAYPVAPAMIIHTELMPSEKTRPGPPTKPKPLMALEKIAMPVTKTPISRPAMKKSRVDLVRRMAHNPTATQRTM
jgi:hypothetical protein